MSNKDLQHSPEMTASSPVKIDSKNAACVENVFKAFSCYQSIDVMEHLLFLSPVFESKPEGYRIVSYKGKAR